VLGSISTKVNSRVPPKWQWRRPFSTGMAIFIREFIYFYSDFQNFNWNIPIHSVHSRGFGATAQNSASPASLPDEAFSGGTSPPSASPNTRACETRLSPSCHGKTPSVLHRPPRTDAVALSHPFVLERQAVVQIARRRAEHRHAIPRGRSPARQLKADSARIQCDPLLCLGKVSPRASAMLCPAPGRCDPATWEGQPSQ
jgi:hypothetical protein